MKNKALCSVLYIVSIICFKVSSVSFRILNNSRINLRKIYKFLGKVFTKVLFDEICYELSNSYINPHKSILNIGNYDINSIIKALEMKNMTVTWYDKRIPITKESICLEQSFGYILNIPSDYSLGFLTLPLIKNRHWLSLRKINDKFYNLDSKISKPKLIGDEEEFVAYLKNEMLSNNKELFIVKERKEETT